MIAWANQDYLIAWIAGFAAVVAIVCMGWLFRKREISDQQRFEADVMTLIALSMGLCVQSMKYWLDRIHIGKGYRITKFTIWFLVAMLLFHIAGMIRRRGRRGGVVPGNDTDG